MASYGKRRTWPGLFYDATSPARTVPVLPHKIPAADVAKMRAEMSGRVVVPGDAGYPNDRLGNPLFPAYPLVIMYCATAADVRVSLGWAQQLKLTVTCRSGGHSTAGFSVNNSMVLDLSLLNYVTIDPTLLQARVGAGTQFAQLDATYDAFGVHAPTGGCADVGVGGFMQGGGYGFTSRQYGIAADRVIGALVMLADGRLVRANATENPDLLWAICGGTGNNFGVVIEFTIQLVKAGPMWGFALSWPIAEAAAAMVALQNGYTLGAGPDQLGFQNALTILDGQPQLMAMGVYNGDKAAGIAAIAPLLSVGHPQIIQDRVGSYNELNSWLIDTCLPGPPPPPPGGNVFEVKGVGYVGRPLDVAGWQAAVDFFLTTPNPYNIMVMESYGGAINAAPANKNAFIHREVYMDLFVDSFWWDPAKRDAAVQWAADFEATLAPWFDGHRYQNYPARNLPNYRWQYWGDAFPSLLFVKGKYDPGRMFCFEQDVSPYPSDPGIARSVAPSLFSDPVIRGVVA